MFELSTENWDFETGDLSGWTATGTAFLSQPVRGDYIKSSRVYALSQGGDYWHTPLFTGYHGNYWICTAFSPAGENAHGTLTSQPFVLTHRYISFLIAGTRDPEHIRVELQASITDLERVYDYSLTTDTMMSQQDALLDPTTTDHLSQKFASLPRDERFLILFSTTGHDSEIMRLEHWNLSALLLDSQITGSTIHMRIKIVDYAKQGHINVDHFQFLDYPPVPYLAPVWGIADLHCHPLAHLSFGGTLIWGKPDNDLDTIIVL